MVNIRIPDSSMVSGTKPLSVGRKKQKHSTLEILTWVRKKNLLQFLKRALLKYTVLSVLTTHPLTEQF